jgi:two-component system nitrogen regulation sensor histidine kinase NtrY
MFSLSHRIHWWQFGILGLALTTTAWLRHPAFVWVAAVWLAVGACVWALWPLRSRLPRITALGLFVLAGTVSVQSYRLRTIDQEWPRIRESLVSAAFRALAGELRAAQEETERVVEAAAAASGYQGEEAFDRLRHAVATQDAELGVAVLDTNDVPFAWAGRFRIAPEARGDSLQVRSNTFYVVLETRGRLEGGRVAVASLLLWAAPSAPDRQRSLAERFREKTKVGLLIFPAGQAPTGVDVFAYEQPTTAGPRQLFAAQPLPPEQGTSKEAALHSAGFGVAALLLLVLALALVAEPSVIGRLLLATSVLWIFLQAPAGEYLGLTSWFSSATFFRTLLGPFSSSAGVLAIAGALVTLGAIALWRKRLPVRWYSAAIGVTLLLVAPYAVRELGRGITPPANGVPLGLWLSWQVTLLLATAAPIALAAALFRGTRSVDRIPPAIWIGAAVAIVATIAGVFVWGPRIGWPPWYTFLWTPALFLVTRPAPRRGAIAGIAVTAGCAAALITWGAVLEGRLNVARKDVGSLGSETYPPALRLLELFGETVQTRPPPASASELYALWRGSPLGEEEYPSQLGLWSPAGEPLVEVRLDSLDVSQALISAFIRNLDSTEMRQTFQLPRTPGVHSILLQRVSPASVMSVVIGPQTRLIMPDRLGRLLHRQSADVPLYSLSLSQPEPGARVDSVRLRWYREGWRVRGERLLMLPEGVRHVHAEVDLRGPVPIFVRGVLVVMLDIGLLTLLWVFADSLVGYRFRRWSWQRLRRSYQARLAVTLGLFFIIPATGFALWGFVRLRAEDDRTQDLVITQTLRDATLASSLGQSSVEPAPDALLQLSRRIDAELGLYRGGALTGSSAQVLEDLGIIPALVPPPAYLALAIEDELDLTSDGPLAEPPIRMGYRVVQPGSPEQIGILSSPHPALDPALGEEQTDLILYLLLATLIGAGCALAGAQAAARALSRPVADLRQSALALGQGRPAEPPEQAPPVEFEEVFGAFGRMAADIRSSQAALEEARRRTAAVLATVATGVVALDAEGRVLIANKRAEELLGILVSEGDHLENHLGPEWAPLVEAVQEELHRGQNEAGERGGDQALSREVDARGRRIRLQLARLESGLRGVVVALNDLTDVSRAERVLAWGEMARQVAHEIKNPLTPLRLGVQHLLRVYRDRPEDFDRTLDDTSARILAEIDRLDTIARAFSRFGAPAEPEAPLESVDLTATATEVVQLYRLAGEGAVVGIEANGPAWSVARKDEVKEVLVNLLENARNAGARRIQVRVAAERILVEDDGEGISPDQLPRIFEPRFSATTSGSGLGLSIVRRLVESWGGKVSVTSEVGQGTRVTIIFPAPTI